MCLSFVPPHIASKDDIPDNKRQYRHIDERILLQSIKKRLNNVAVIVKVASNNRLSVIRTTDR
ncbi:hypothetical protein RG31_18300 [Escherichia coli]|nr:hypothetical protein RG31_18300 [Escherichia coli]